MWQTHRSNLEDPYITLQPAAGDGSEDEDDAIRDTDLIILAARNEDDVSHLEVPLPASKWSAGCHIYRTSVHRYFDPRH